MKELPAAEAPPERGLSERRGFAAPWSGRRGFAAQSIWRRGFAAPWSRSRDEPARAAGAGRTSLEVQVHPADIRRRVRYYFLGRGEVTALSLLLLVYLLFVAVAASLAPHRLRDDGGEGEYQALAGERMRQGQRVQELVGRLDQLADRGADLRLQLARVRLAYGLPAAAGPAPAAPGAPGESAPGSIYSATVEQGRRLSGRLGGGQALASASLAELERFEREHPEEVATTPSTCPLESDSFVLTTPFERVRSPFTRELEFHTGIDLAAPVGTPVHAPADGVVAFAGESPVGAAGRWWRLGKLVVLAHGARYATAFGHLDRIDVRPGQRVRRGEVLGAVGATGRSTHPHVHYEVRRLGPEGERPLDPRLFVLDRRWPGEEGLLAETGSSPSPADFDPLPLPRGRRRSR